jgi:hypothetical protein
MWCHMASNDMKNVEWMLDYKASERTQPCPNWDACYCKEAIMGNIISISFSNRHYYLVSRNVNIWFSSLCPLPYAVTEWMEKINIRRKCIQMAQILYINPNIPQDKRYHSVYKEHILHTWIMHSLWNLAMLRKKFRIKTTVDLRI